MKKNISINISGIIFHIEEDGYENLRKYLDSISKYFSTFEDSSEIMADIESRIAEIFLSKLNEGKQVITSEDVQALITTMGSVSDFKAAEEQEFAQAPHETYEEQKEGSSSESSAKTSFLPPKHLVRDQKRKILGGVCAGLGNYLNVDPLWVRLLFAVFIFAWGFTIFVYIIMWIVVPGSYDLGEIEVEKKMYRDPERKVLGGVAGGVAAYLNVDVLAVRVLFIIFAIVGGLGFFLYIVLWVILPEARTLTDRMQMQGEAVTLSNIEMNIKKNQGPEASSDESTLTKIILFPFRIIAIIIQALGKVIRPLLDVIRVAIGIFITLLGLSMAFAAVVTGGIALGIFSAATFGSPGVFQFDEVSIPVHALVNAFPGWVALAGFLVALIPCLFIIMLGLSVITQRLVFSAPVGWSMFVVLFVGIIILAVGVPKIVYSFKEYGEYTVENTYRPTTKRVLMRVREAGLDDYRGVNLRLKGHDQKTFKLVQTFSAQGSTGQAAIQNAQMVEYTMQFQDSLFLFDNNIRFKPDAIFRDQRLDMVLYVPYDYPFVMDGRFWRFINTYVEYEYRDGYEWKMTSKDGLVCNSCPKPTAEELARQNLRDFTELDLRGIFDVRINRGDEFSVELDGPESEEKRYEIYRSGETLVIDFEGKKNFRFDWKHNKSFGDQVRITITMPSLERLEATGFGSIRFGDFQSDDDIEIEIRGPIDVRGELRAENVNVNLTGKAELELTGRATKLNADVELASRLKGYNFEVTDANIEVSGASAAKVYVTGKLEMEEGVASDIDYRGNPVVIKRDN